MAMIKCPECGKDISNQSDKCIYCGFPIRNEDMIVCSNCGVLNQAGSTFCSSCGNPLVKGITALSVLHGRDWRQVLHDPYSLICHHSCLTAYEL